MFQMSTVFQLFAVHPSATKSSWLVYLKTEFWVGVGTQLLVGENQW